MLTAQPSPHQDGTLTGAAGDPFTGKGAFSVADLNINDLFLLRDVAPTPAATKTLLYGQLTDAIRTDIYEGGQVVALSPSSLVFSTGLTATANTTGDVTIVATGGGGSGTDDQTATEVPVTASGFTGNLGSGDTNVQAALDTIDGFTLGGGGGGDGVFSVTDLCVDVSFFVTSSGEVTRRELIPRIV